MSAFRVIRRFRDLLDVNWGSFADQDVAQYDSASGKLVGVPAGGGAPSGAAGGVLAGTYPNPSFAADMATQAELDAHTGDTSDAHDASAISAVDAGGYFTGTDLEAITQELGADVGSQTTDLANHIADPTAAHAASAVSASSTTLVGIATDVQGVLEELDNGIADHLADAADAHAGTAITNTSAGNVASTTVQAAINELDKAPFTSKYPLRRWHYALGNRATAPVDVVFIGDSIVGGRASGALAGRFTYRTVDILRDTLQPAGVAGGWGFEPPRRHASYTWTDAIVSSAGTVGFDSVRWGLRQNGCLFNGAGDTLTYTIPNVTGVDIHYLVLTNGNPRTIRYRIDAGAWTSIQQFHATTANNAAVAQVRSIGGGAHTLTIEWVAGSAYCTGVTIYDGDESLGIRCWDGGIPSQTTAYWVDPSFQYWIDTLSVITNPALFVIALGVNDLITYSAATFKTNLQTLIANIKTELGYAPSIVLAALHDIGSGSQVEAWANYVASMYQVAAADVDECVAVFDWYAMVNDNATGGTIGGLIDADLVHPTKPGHEYLALALARFLTP